VHPYPRSQIGCFDLTPAKVPKRLLLPVLSHSRQEPLFPSQTHASRRRGAARVRERTGARQCRLAGRLGCGDKRNGAKHGKPRASYSETAPGEPGDQERWNLWHAARCARRNGSTEHVRRCAGVCGGGTVARCSREKETSRKKIEWGMHALNDGGSTCKKTSQPGSMAGITQRKRGGAARWPGFTERIRDLS
jgi:hypothetical protein